MKKKLFQLFQLFQGSYDPVKYWNKRENPNNSEGENPLCRDFDVDFIKKVVGDVKSSLELGPGVGRTFAAYSENHQLTTLDVSSMYQDQLLSISKGKGIVIKQLRVAPDEKFPFDACTFPVGVVSQVLLHIPPELIKHSLSELVRVCNKVVVITAYTHGLPINGFMGKHVFNHDYFSISTDLDCVMNDVVMNNGRICFTLSKRQGVMNSEAND